jgi:superfamily II DNA or RNA helicase
VPPFAFVLRTDLSRPDDVSLLTECVTVSLELHPAVRQTLDRIGTRRGSTSYTIPLKDLHEALALFPSATIAVPSKRGTRLTRSTRELGESLGYELKQPSLAQVVHAARGMRVSVHRSSRNRATLTFIAHEVAIGTQHVSSTWERVLSVEDAYSLLEVLDDRVVLDGSSGAWSSMQRLLESALVVSELPDDPGLARVRVGTATALYITAAAALDRLARHTGSVACAKEVADVAQISSTKLVHDEVLLEHQQLPSSLYLSSKWGVVLALPPGSGKTAVALRSLHHRSQRGALTSIVVAPGALCPQWESEARRFHPSAEVFLLGRDKIVDSAGRPRLVLASYDAARLHVEQLSRLRADDLIIDEAVFLRNDSKRTRALRSLRTSVSRTMLLSGTPHDRSIDELAPLVSFIIGRSVFEAVPLSKPHATTWQDRVGPFVAGLWDAPTAVLPNLERRVIELQPSSDEEALFEGATLALEFAQGSLVAADSNTARRDARLMVSNATLRLRDTLADPLSHQERGSGASNTKRAALSEVLEDGTTTVVCVRSASTASSIADWLSEQGYAAVAVTSTTPRKQKDEVRAELGRSIQVAVLAAQSSVGWDLPAARRVVHLDAPASRAEELQRSSRARRVSSKTSAIDVVFLCYKNTSEESLVTELLKG